jgi:branched-chain amino acid transport system ATP-binding protein
MLIAKNISSYYGNIQALDDISIEVKKGEIVSIIGSNGAGKSTLLMTLCGIVPAKTGSIIFNDTEISTLPTHEIIRMGVSQSPEGRRIFPKLTVYENLLIGDPLKREKDINLEFIFEIFPILKERINQRGGTLSGGEQQMLSIGRALVSQPSLLLLDEPSLGLAPIIVKQIFEIIKRINKENDTTILLVEQNAFGALKLSDRGYVLVNGKVTISGESKQLLENPEIKKAYLEGV